MDVSCRFKYGNHPFPKENIKMLPNVERAIVTMYLDDLPYKDIAENLGITEVNARVKMNRLKKTLKELMEKHG